MGQLPHIKESEAAIRANIRNSFTPATEEELLKSWSTELRDKNPDSRWLTMSGSHVLVGGNGEILAASSHLKGRLEGKAAAAFIAEQAKPKAPVAAAEEKPELDEWGHPVYKDPHPHVTAKAVGAGLAEECYWGKGVTADMAEQVVTTVQELHDKYKMLPLASLNIEDPSAHRINAESAGSSAVYNYGGNWMSVNSELFSEEDAQRRQKVFDRFQQWFNIPSYEKAKANFDAHKAKEKDVKKLPYTSGGKRSKYYQKWGVLENELRVAKAQQKEDIYPTWTVGVQHGVKSTVLHEMGHALHNQYFGLKSGNSLGMKPLVEAKEAKAWNQELTQLHKDSVKNKDMLKISQYAASEPSEFFAEAFALYHIDAKQLPKKIKSFMDKTLQYAAK